MAKAILKGIKTPRIEVIDALRGFAVMAILLVHNVEHFIYNVYPDPLGLPGWLNLLNTEVGSFVFAIFAGKAYSIFALLFGFTYYIQFTNQRNSGKDFSFRFVWRLLLLTVFATINAAFFPGGDVLLLFAVVGVVLIIARKLSDKVVFIMMALFLFQPMEWYYYIQQLVNPDFVLPAKHAGGLYGEIFKYVSEGTLVDFIVGNITIGQKASLLWAIEGGRFFQTAGLFLLGLLLGRRQLFVFSEETKKFWIKALVYASVVFLPLFQLKLNISAMGGYNESIGVVLDMWSKLAFTFVLVASFILMYQFKGFHKMAKLFVPYGKMSLTNYILQSIIGFIIYLPLGLSLAKYCGNTLSLLIGIVVFILQLQFCKWWLLRFKQGPLEKLWHKATWIKLKK